ncbi:MAG: YdcF family protein [Verrucomicrobiota bacterium]
MKRRVRTILLGLAAVFSAWLVIAGIVIWRFGDENHAEKSDCIIVLGAAAYGAEPSPVFEERIKHAINLLQEGEGARIIFTGGFGDGAKHAESEVGAEYSVRKGVDPKVILTETRSRTTRQNLVEAKALMDAAGLKTAILVSDPLHLKRASLMAEDLGISAVTSPTPSSRYRSFGPKLMFLLREIYFLNHYWVTGN